MKRTFHFAIGGVFGKEASFACGRDGLTRRCDAEAARASSSPPRAQTPVLLTARPPPARPPPRSFPRFPTLAAAPAPCRRTPAPCGVSCGRVQAGAERAGGGARAQVRRDGRTYVRSAARWARLRRCAPVSASPMPCVRAARLPPAQWRAARQRQPGCGRRQHAGSGRRARGALCGGSSAGRSAHGRLCGLLCGLGLSRRLGAQEGVLWESAQHALAEMCRHLRVAHRQQHGRV